MTMWSSWFGGGVQEERLPFTTINRKEHSPGCRMLGSIPCLMIDLDMIHQDIVMECPHRNHDSVKQIFKVWCDETYETSKDVSEGRLF